MRQEPVTIRGRERRPWHEQIRDFILRSNEPRCALLRVLLVQQKKTHVFEPSTSVLPICVPHQSHLSTFANPHANRHAERQENENECKSFIILLLMVSINFCNQAKLTRVERMD